LRRKAQRIERTGALSLRSGGSGNPIYTAKLQILHEDFPQYIHDNTEDEFTHQNFLNACLAPKRADTVSLE
jgi:hypothetical protein